MKRVSWSICRLAPILGIAIAGACSPEKKQVVEPDPVVPVDTVSAAGPALVSGNDLVAATVGVGVTYDATRSGSAFTDPYGKGLTYSIALTGPAAGFTSTGGSISGTPTNPGVAVATITASDARGKTAVDRFPIVIFSAGLATPKSPAAPYKYADASTPLPSHFITLINGSSVASNDNTPITNPITDAGAALGRVLFYDPRLSTNDALPCASCHVQSLGFSDNLKFSVGFEGGLTGRHAPGLSNARFYKSGRFFWDERAATLEEQVLGPIQNPVEMGMKLDTLVLKLRAAPYYTALFTSAFGSSEITSDKVSRALAQFVRSLTSSTSRYDRFLAGTGALTAQEQQGEGIFRTAGCTSCHTTVAQVSDAAHNTGLDATNTDVGTGHGAVKVPSLRNVAVRPRFMHDGRFTSLEEVVEFYDSGVQANPDLDSRLKNATGSPSRLGLGTADTVALVAFLRTLTDSTFLTDARLSDPFAPPVVIVPPTPGTALITIQGNAYHPNSLTVAPGTTIIYTNADNRRHSAKFASASIVSTPIFTSGTQSVAMPSVPGTYPFQCAVHGAAMTGTIVVK